MKQTDISFRVQVNDNVLQPELTCEERKYWCFVPSSCIFTTTKKLFVFKKYNLLRNKCTYNNETDPFSTVFMTCFKVNILSYYECRFSDDFCVSYTTVSITRGPTTRVRTLSHFTYDLRLQWTLLPLFCCIDAVPTDVWFCDK